MLNFIEKGNKINPQYALIWLHGLGEDGNTASNDIYKLLDAELLNKFILIFPSAKVRSMTFLNGEKHHSWYDKISSEDANQFDIINSKMYINNIIQLINIKYSIEKEKIVLIGFSQGGVIAMSLVISNKDNYACAIGISTFSVLDKIGNCYRNLTPILLLHGINDDVVSISRGKKLFTDLIKYGYSVNLIESNKEHYFDKIEINIIQNYIKKTLNL